MSGKKLADIFKGRREETEKPREEDADDNSKALLEYTIKFITALLMMVVVMKRKMRASRGDTVTYCKDMDG